MLKDINIPVFFEKENINTMDAKGEVLITIMASLAQQESESISKNVKLGLQYRYQHGKVLLNSKYFLGYDKDEDGNLVVNPKEAEVVKRIFLEYLQGSSCQKIAKGNGTIVQSEKSLKMKNIWVMHFCRKPIRWIS